MIGRITLMFLITQMPQFNATKAQFATWAFFFSCPQMNYWNGTEFKVNRPSIKLLPRSHFGETRSWKRFSSDWFWHIWVTVPGLPSRGTEIAAKGSGWSGQKCKFDFVNAGNTKQLQAWLTRIIFPDNTFSTPSNSFVEVLHYDKNDMVIFRRKSE